MFADGGDMTIRLYSYGSVFSLQLDAGVHDVNRTTVFLVLRTVHVHNQFVLCLFGID